MVSKEKAAEILTEELERHNWIESDQVGQHETLVWLTIDTEGGQGGKGVQAFRVKLEEESPY